MAKPKSDTNVIPLDMVETTVIPVHVKGDKDYVPSKMGHRSTDIYLENKINKETERATEEEANLQEQINSLSRKSFSVKDVVHTKADLTHYDTSLLLNDDIIEVLTDESRNNATSFYKYVQRTDSFVCIGTLGPYYNTSTIDDMIADLTAQIALVNSKSAVRDVVATKEDLSSYVTTWLVANDIVIVLRDSTNNNETSYYKWDGSAFLSMGLVCPYYTKGQLDVRFAAIEEVLANHEVRITANRNDIDARMSYEDTEEALEGDN